MAIEKATQTFNSNLFFSYLDITRKDKSNFNSILHVFILHLNLRHNSVSKDFFYQIGRFHIPKSFKSYSNQCHVVERLKGETEKERNQFPP